MSQGENTSRVKGGLCFIKPVKFGGPIEIAARHKHKYKAFL